MPALHLSQAVVHEVADHARESVAVEMLWPGQAFVGARWPLGELADAVHALDRLDSRRTQRGASSGGAAMGVFAALTALLSAEPRAELAFVEVGAVNAWRSVGAEEIWHADRPVPVRRSVRRLRQRPDLLLCPHPVAVEFAGLRPRPHWIGVTVSTPEGPRHRLNQTGLTRLLTTVIGAR